MRTSLSFAGLLALVLAACGGASEPKTPPSSGPIPTAPPPKPVQSTGSLADSSDEDAKAIAAGGDDASPSDTAPASGAGAAVEVTPKDGDTVAVKLGQDIVVTLQNPEGAADSEWKAVSFDKTLGAPKREKVDRGAKFVWSTKSPLDVTGKHVVELHLTSPKKKDPEKKVVVTFDVTK